MLPSSAYAHALPIDMFLPLSRSHGFQMMRAQYFIAAILFLAFPLVTGACDRDIADDDPPQQQEESDEEAAAVEVDGDEADDEYLRPEDITVSDPGPIERPLLWRADGPNGPVWLFGTIHGGVDASDWDTLPTEVRRAIEASDTTVLEIDVRAMETSPALLEAMALPDGESLREMLGEEHWEVFNALLDGPALGPGPEQFEPWMAYSVMLMVMLGELAFVEMVDQSIQRHAERNDHSLEYLESIEQQLKLMQEAMGVEYLVDFLDDPVSHRDELQQMLNAYVAGDPEALEEIMFDPADIEEHADFYEVMFYERHNQWWPKIVDYVERGDVFIAVGAGHLVGDGSVIDMLDDEGIDVERVGTDYD